MEVAEMRDGEAVEGARQTFEGNLSPHQVRMIRLNKAVRRKHCSNSYDGARV
jgi:hypothetical protein